MSNHCPLLFNSKISASSSFCLSVSLPTCLFLIELKQNKSKNIYIYSLSSSPPAGITIGGSRGACPVHAPLWDPILSFLHTFSPKSAHVGGPPPPNGCTLPPTGNPGSTTDHECLCQNAKLTEVQWSETRYAFWRHLVGNM